MGGLAAYVMRGRMQAILVTAVAAVSALMLPPLSYLSGGAVALVTLRRGGREGVAVILGAALAAIAVVLPLTGSVAPGVAYIGALWLPVWLLSITLRRTVSLPLALLMAGAIGAAVVVVTYGLLPDPTAWWKEELRQLLPQLAKQGGGDAEQLRAGVEQMARFMTGAMAAGLSLSLIGCLFLGRWWQAMLYNPGGFREEFHNLRLGRHWASLSVVLVLIAAAGDGGISAPAWDLVLVALTLNVLQGLAVVHGIVRETGAHIGWLVTVYILLVITLPQTVLTLAMAGLADNWVDFRRIVARRRNG